MERETPSSIMYADLKKFAHISNRDAAKILLSSKPTYGGSAPADRVDERTFLSREVVHAEPGGMGEMLYADFTKSAQTLTALMLKKMEGENPAITIISHYAGEGCEQMCTILREWNLDATLYSNMTDKVLNLVLRTAVDRATLCVLLFCATGSLGDPKRACQIVEHFTNSLLGMELRTTRASVENFTDPVEAEAGSLGLARVVNGRMKASIFPVSEDKAGTVIGALATSESSITDVDMDVSRQHARIWLDGGHWYIEDLGSTNGTTLVRGTNKASVTLSAHMRYELFPSDVICLGATTRFMVLGLAK